MSEEIKIIIQILLLIVLVANLGVYVYNTKIISKVKSLPQEIGEEFEKERAKLNRKEILGTKATIIFYIIICIYLLLNIFIPSVIKEILGGDDMRIMLNLVIALIVAFPIAENSYKNIKVWNKLKREKDIN